MAVRDWHGSADDDFENANNWTAAVVPADGDTWRALNSANPMATNLDQSAKNFALVVIGAGMTGNIGSAGTYLEMGCTSLLCGGGGDIFIDDGAADPAQDIASVIVTGTGTGKSLNLKGEIGTLDVRKGTVNYFGATEELDNLIVSWLTSQTGDATVVFNGAAKLKTSFKSYGGTTLITGDCDLDAVVAIYGGTVTVQELSAAPAGLITVHGGSLIWNAEDDPTNAGDLDVHGGLLDFSQDMRAKAPGNEIRMYGAANINVRNGAANIDYSGGGIGVYGVNMPTLPVGAIID